MKKLLSMVCGVLALASLAFAGNVNPGGKCSQSSECKQFIEPVECQEHVCCERSVWYQCTAYEDQSYCAAYSTVCTPTDCQTNDQGQTVCNSQVCHQECSNWVSRPNVCVDGYYPWNCEPQDMPK